MLSDVKISSFCLPFPQSNCILYMVHGASTGNNMVNSIIRLANGEYREVIEVTYSLALLDDGTTIGVSDIEHVLSDEEVADLVMDRMTDV